MMDEYDIAVRIPPANHFLWAVRTYLDLIENDKLLTYGTGLRRLYTMASGVTTLNNDDIRDLTEKASELKILPENLRGFMNQSISKNLYLYGVEMQRLIAQRVVGIARGDIKNPDSFVTGNADEARRYYYTPPLTFLVRLAKALNDDVGVKDWGSMNQHSIANSLFDVSNDAIYLLSRIRAEEGYSTPTETSWSKMMSLVDRMVLILHDESFRSTVAATYKTRSLAITKILWYISKLIMGDLTIQPHRRDTNRIDLDQTMTISDGTLAAIPFPLRQTISVFMDDDQVGMSMKARIYLSAVSAAAFYRQDPE